MSIALTTKTPGACVARCKRTSGFTLIEVLVTVIVLSVGLLGLAGLQAIGLRDNHSATLRSIATLQAYDLADRMRANRAGLANYNVAFGVIPVAPNCAVACTSAEIATLDLSQWNTDNASLLPAGTGEVRSNAAGIFTISLRWTEAGNSVTFATSLQP